MIEVTNLTRSWGKVEAVRGVSFRVQPGEIYGPPGPNGAGRSTTIHITCGLVPPPLARLFIRLTGREPRE